MIFVLDTTIGIGIWLPFTVGKSLALLSVSKRRLFRIRPLLTAIQLDPRRLLYILHFPIRVIRIITDPIVDAFMFMLTRLAVPPLLRFCQAGLELSFRVLCTLIGYEGATRGAQLTTNLVSYLARISDAT